MTYKGTSTKMNDLGVLPFQETSMFLLDTETLSFFGPGVHNTQEHVWHVGENGRVLRALGSARTDA